jgi:hypothetical protein
MATCEQLTAWLSEAEAALHKINVEGQVVELQDQNLERVAYSRVNVDKLLKYIGWLTQQKATVCGTGSLAANYGPLRPFF